MPIVTGKPASPEQLMRKIMRLSQLCPNGFRNPRQGHGGPMTLTERVGIAAGVLDDADIAPEPSERGRKKRLERRVTRAVIAEERAEREAARRDRRPNSGVSLDRENAIRAEILAEAM